MEKKILIIDDEADVITYLTMVLKSNDFEPYAIDNVISAMNDVERIQPDLICLDIMMPRETGISFYKILRKSKNFSHIPVIIISGVVQTGKFDFQSYVKDKSIPPPECYMEKPIDVDRFISTINKLISGKSISK
jgi:CheY-like chemotaxis protein